MHWPSPRSQLERAAENRQKAARLLSSKYGGFNDPLAVFKMSAFQGELWKFKSAELCLNVSFCNDRNNFFSFPYLPDSVDRSAPVVNSVKNSNRQLSPTKSTFH